MTRQSIYLIGLLALFCYSCGKPDLTDDLLDGPLIFDPSLYNPEEYLISEMYPNPTTEDLSKPIIIAIHGYSATTFEWQEFKDWSVDDSYRISQVLLGGHGKDYDSFKASTWKDWSLSIKKEYNKLTELGYKNISLVGSSTGGTLLLELIGSSYFKNTQSPKHIFLVDPILVASNKLQSIVGIVGPMLGYVEVDLTKEESEYWYTFRPQETIRELNEVMRLVRKDLEDGITLPLETQLKVFHSIHDPVASSTSSVLIYKGLKANNGNPIEVELMDSDIHVFTRLSLRSNVTALELENQQNAFQQMALKLTSK